MNTFINLHTNTEYSILESTIRIDELISFALKNNLKALSITDHNVMYGVAEFTQKCIKNNIKPIIGLDLDVDNYQLILLAKNNDGYKELIRLSSLKNKNNLISVNDIYIKDLYVIDHPTKGYYCKTKRHLDLDGSFIGVETQNIPNGIRVLDTRFLFNKDKEALKTLSSISGKEIPLFNQLNAYEDFLELPNDAMMEQAINVAQDCNVTFKDEKLSLPKFKTPNNISSIAYLKTLLQKEAKNRFKEHKNVGIYLKRIKYEVRVIEELGFADYFLIVWDFIKWAREKDIAVGPGRGSSASSLISFLLNITEVDPIQYGLIFERFLNPERVTMPDIDIDIQDSRRQEVVDYIFNKYGKDHTALIITFQKLGAKMSLRDTGRSLNMPLRDVDEISKAVPAFSSLKEAYKNSPLFKSLINKSEINRKLFETAKKIEGIPRQVGTHAAGVVISDKPIEKSVPTIFSQDGMNQTQYSMNFLESKGLLKIDILGLRNLSTIQTIQNLVYKNFKKKISLSKINFNDKLTNNLLSDGDTNGIFQLESYGMKSTVAKVGVDSIDDIVAIISLYRPGPMDNISLYIERKKGLKEIPKISEQYDAILKNTYGIIIYQEQIMEIAQKISGMSFGQADILRRAISKKNFDLIKSLKEKFINGGIQNGYPKDVIIKIYENVEKFADYGFNKAHAVAYAFLAYRMAFLKARFPLEFYTALLSASKDSQKSIMKYVHEAKSKLIKIMAPEINQAQNSVVNKNNVIIMPLTIIKGFGSAANLKLLSERQNGDFEDFFDFVSRMKISGFGNSTIELLVNSNTLRKFGNMQTLLDSLPSAIRYSDMITIKSDGKMILEKNLIAKPKLIKTKRNIDYEISLEEKLFGFKFNAFQTEDYQTSETLLDLKNKKSVEIAIYLERIFRKKDKNNNQYARVLISDSTSNIELNIFADKWKFISDCKTKKVYIATIKKESYNGLDTYKLVKPWKEVSDE